MTGHAGAPIIPVEAAAPPVAAADAAPLAAEAHVTSVNTSDAAVAVVAAPIAVEPSAGPEPATPSAPTQIAVASMAVELLERASVSLQRLRANDSAASFRTQEPATIAPPKVLTRREKKIMRAKLLSALQSFKFVMPAPSQASVVTLLQEENEEFV